MNAIEQLIAGLSTITPLSEEFKAELRPILRPKVKQNHKAFLRINRKAKLAWQLLSGIVVAVREINGRECAVKIYQPGQIFTDLHSFFENQPIRNKIISASKVEILELRKADFEKLSPYPETHKLVQHIMLQEQTIESRRAEMLNLHHASRIKEFAKDYPIIQIPNHYAASFLNMEEHEYFAHKLAFLASAQQQDSKNIRRTPYSSTHEMAHAVKNYISENYDQQHVGDTLQIAKQFHTTRKTLTRAFNKAFGMTAQKMILELRMKKAIELLNLEKNREISIGEIAEKLGYPSLYEFSRVFKKYYGHAPNQARPK